MGFSQLKDKLGFSSSASTYEKDTTVAQNGVSHNMEDPTTDERRGEQILSVFDATFRELLDRDPNAFQTKFRKMAGSAFAFYRGSASLFYHDLSAEQHDGPYLNERSRRVWIHGDLHAENFGTYMNSRGRLVFNVNDFDEAYIGPFIWDLKRFVASIALIGYKKALSDKQIEEVVQAYASAYHERIHVLSTAASYDEVPSFTLESATGPLLDALHSARLQTRAGLLDGMTEVHNYERRFKIDEKAFKLNDSERDKVLTAFDGYKKTLPNLKHSLTNSFLVKDVIGRRSVGIGSAGLPSHTILLDGNTDALENDVTLYMKQAQTPALSMYIKDAKIRDHFKNEGHRSVLSRRALQRYSDPLVGWTDIDGIGQLVAEISPYESDLDWSDINDPKDILAVVADLGRATAMMHAAGDEEEENSGLVPFSVEKAIDAEIHGDLGNFKNLLVRFAHDYSRRVRDDHQIFVDLFRNGRIRGLEPSENT